MTPDTPADGEALAEAIAEAVAYVRQAEPVDEPWRASTFGHGPLPNAIATILNAVLSGALIPRPAEPAQAAQVDATDDATAFERADWFWRTMDPDDCGDSPEEAINRAMVGRFCVCEIASSYKGPTRYGFIAPVADPESDNEEFVHFATHPEAIDEARSRARIAAAQEGRE